MKRHVIGSLLILILILLGGKQTIPVTLAASLQATPLPQQDSEGPAVEAALNTALQTAIHKNEELRALGFLIYDVVVDHIQYSQDGSTALMWLALRDPHTQEVIATEPGLSIANNPTLADPRLAANWQVTLQDDTDWLSQLQTLPADLQSEELLQRFNEASSQTAIDPQAAPPPLTGYKLPWSKDLKNGKKLTGSIGHFLIYNSCSEASCRYAYDFADGTMFPLLASKGGVVKYAKWICVNGDTSCTNYLVLEDQSTTPYSYQLYYHLANNSIPDDLRVPGTIVRQGQFIANVDDTGYSTGHHLHFHVYTSPTGSNYSWGNSVNYIFDDVTINGGYPRTCYEATNYPGYGTECNAGADSKRGTSDDDWFVSGNSGANLPTGEITSPAPGTNILTPTITVNGSFSDDIGVQRVQILALFNGDWNVVKDQSVDKIPGATFSLSFDTCLVKVSSGPFQVAVRFWDYEGNASIDYIGQRTLTKGYPCYEPPPPPACTPGTNEASLYANPDFTGACKKFALGSYDASKLGSLGDNNAASIQVGSGVRAILYDNSADLKNVPVQGRIETFDASDTSLSDNRIGADSVSAVVVAPQKITDTSGLEPILKWPGNVKGINPSVDDSLVLSWTGGEGANQFLSEVKDKNGVVVKKLDWQPQTSWSIGNLPAGTFTWSVKARNSAYPTLTNTDSLTFTVDAVSLNSTPSLNPPYSQDFQGGAGDWTASGLWRQDTVEMGNRGAMNAWIYNDKASKNYADSIRRAGDLTSPPILIPPTGDYYLRFSSYSAVESGSPFWDQRRVQISVNGAPYVDLYQFSDDIQQDSIWIDSPAIQLEDPTYSSGDPNRKVNGKSVRIRFHFDTVDNQNNNTWGWMVSNVSIGATAPDLSCADTNNSVAEAHAIQVGDSAAANLCPQGDIDYFAFDGIAGQTLQFDIDARVDGSKLDSYLSLLDSDGVNVLAENDDEVRGEGDSLLSYVLQRTGKYYLKVRAWNHPGAGGSEYTYTLKITPWVGNIDHVFLPVLLK